MHAISSYRGNRPTNTHTHRQDRLQYTTPLSLARRYKVQYRSGNSLLSCIGPQQNSPYARPHNATEQAPDVHHRAAAEDHPAPGGQYSSQISASLVATRTRRAYSIHFNQTGDKSRADARTQSQPLLSNQRSRYCTLIYRRDQTTAPLTAVLQIACTSPLLRKHVQKRPCLHVGNPTAKTEYFPSEV